MIIYKITNLINSKLYIGQTIRSIDVRWKAHLIESNLKNQRRPFCRAIKKYGKENFIIEQIDSAETMEELNQKEEYWIAFYDTCNYKFGYNATSGGSNRIPTTQTRKKMSDKKKGKQIPHFIGYKHSNNPETMKKLKECHLGQKAWNKGLPQSEKQKKEHSERMKGRTAHNKGVFVHCPIRRINLITNEIVEFENKQTAADSIGITKPRINQALKGNYPVINKTYTFELI